MSALLLVNYTLSVTRMNSARTAFEDFLPVLQWFPPMTGPDGICHSGSLGTLNVLCFEPLPS